MISVILRTLLLLGLFLSSLKTVQAQRSACMPNFVNPSDWVKTDFCTTAIDLNDIFSGGPGRDGIPSIDAPIFESIKEASTWLGEKSPVIVVAIDGEARAYPQSILIWHEIVNDVLAETPIAVTFCPLCNSSLVFDRTVGETILEFGVSGLLRNSDMVMYDRQTESWWQQFTGEGIVGTYTNALLDVLPSQVIGFAQFAEKYPNGAVLSRQTGETRNYGTNPYVNYDQTRRPFLFRGQLDNRLAPVAHVLAGSLGEISMAYPFEVLQRQRVLNDTLGETPVVVFWQSGTASALNLADIDASQDIGTSALYSRVVGDQTLTFALNEAGELIDEQTASTWDVFGAALTGELAGTQLENLRFAPHFWFAWVAFQPETRLFQP